MTREQLIKEMYEAQNAWSPEDYADFILSHTEELRNVAKSASAINEKQMYEIAELRKEVKELKDVNEWNAKKITQLVNQCEELKKESESLEGSLEEWKADFISVCEHRDEIIKENDRLKALVYSVEKILSEQAKGHPSKDIVEICKALAKIAEYREGKK